MPRAAAPGSPALERQRAEQDVGEQADHLAVTQPAPKGYCWIITASAIAESSSVLSTRCSSHRQAVLRQGAAGEHPGAAQQEAGGAQHDTGHVQVLDRVVRRDPSKAGPGADR